MEDPERSENLMSITHADILASGGYRELSVAGIDRAVLIRLYRFMLRLRMLEETIAREYHPADEMACPVHLCIGQEATSAALSEVVLPTDYFFAHHRGHGYYLAKHAPLRALIAELYGRATGANGGKAGSQDISLGESRFFGGAILAGGIGIAVGAALAAQQHGTQEIAVTGFGEGAADEGLFWEAVNYAALKRLPLLFVCENNAYATYSPQASRQVRDNLSEKVTAFGVPSRDVFGNDAAALYRALAEIVPAVRSGEGPYFLQAYTYRWNAHVGPEDDSHVGYRPEAEKDFWKRNCPIQLLEERLLAEGMLDPESKRRFEQSIESEIADAFTFARNSPFPEAPDWRALNEASSSPLAERLLMEITGLDFDGHQQEARPGPY